MTNMIEALFGAGLSPRTDFPTGSRYHGAAVCALQRPDGTTIVYLARRLAPAPDRFATLTVHRVTAGERLDRITARLVGDPEQFWQLCDANGAIWPDELEAPEASIRHTLPIDVPGRKDEE